ncbi:MAG: hypothetical protein HW380_3982, partial [Magnetococcales bacterium]|nr:hypothetical protein [Magnetococcales bacterium]
PPAGFGAAPQGFGFEFKQKASCLWGFGGEAPKVFARRASCPVLSSGQNPVKDQVTLTTPWMVGHEPVPLLTQPGRLPGMAINPFQRF